MNNSTARTLTIFSYGMCNLNCVYCTIDKNKYLKVVDDELKKSFENYEEEYIPRIRKWFDKYSLENIETWGGEPLYDIERTFPLMKWLLKEYPNFNKFFSSTNFSYPHWSDKVINLINFFSENSNDIFNIDLQLSIDGPLKINDANRGKGTTDNCLKNIKLLVKKLKKNPVPNNINLTFFVKPTLSVTNIEEDLNSKEAIIDYFKYIEDNIYKPLSTTNAELSFGIPNVASPSPVTVKTGKCFANICKWCRELEKDAKKYFEFYTEICPYSGLLSIIEDNKIHFDLKSNISGCGTGTDNIMMLPHNYYVTCHGSYGDLVSEYRKIAYNSNQYENKQINLYEYMKNTQLPYLRNEEQYERFSIDQEHLCSLENTMKGAFSKAVINNLAKSGQIDKKYLNENEQYRALTYLSTLCNYCVYNNQAINNTIAVGTTEEYKLFLNGALDYILCEK